MDQHGSLDFTPVVKRKCGLVVELLGIAVIEGKI
jgi:hypothetical protein